MRWKPLFAVLLGLLMVGVTAGGVYLSEANSKFLHSLVIEQSSTSTYVSTKPITGSSHPPVLSQPEPSGSISKVFTGKDAVSHANAFIAKKHLTLVIKFNSTKNITFIGIALRPVGNGVYAPAYYVVEGAKPEQYAVFQKKFAEFTRRHVRAKVSDLKIASTINPNVDWNYAGTIDWITHSVSYLELQKGYLEFEGWYYYYVVDENTVEYYGRTKIRGDVSSSGVAVKDISLHVSRGHSHETINDFLPDGHIGPVTSYQESIMVELDPEKIAKISASAGYSVNTNDGYYFRIDTHTGNPNDYVDFHAYDFKKKSLGLDPPAWGHSFYLITAVTMKTTSTGTACYFGVFNYKVNAQFYFLTWGADVITKSPEPVEASVFVYPPRTVFSG